MLAHFKVRDHEEPARLTMNKPCTRILLFLFRWGCWAGRKHNYLNRVASFWQVLVYHPAPVAERKGRMEPLPIGVGTRPQFHSPVAHPCPLPSTPGQGQLTGNTNPPKIEPFVHCIYYYILIKVAARRKTFLCAVAAQMFHKVVPMEFEARA